MASSSSLMLLALVLYYLSRCCLCNHISPGLETEISFSFQPPFTNNRYLNVQGNASKTVDGVELTTNAVDGAFLNSVGRAFYATPVQFLDPEDATVSVSFSSIFTFKVVQFNTSYYKAGDGLAFVIVADPVLPMNSSGMYLGLTNESLNGDPGNRLLAVEFDTFKNEGVDPVPDHIGVDVNGIQTTDMFTLEGELANLLRSNFTLTAWIEYNSFQQLLEVRIANADERPQIPLLRSRVRLTDIVQEKMYVGFTAATGYSYELHKILSWKFATYRNYSRKRNSTDPDYVYIPKESSECRRWICKKLALVLLPGIGVLSLIALGGVLWFWIIARCQENKNFTSLPSSVQYFTFKQLSAATRSFSSKELIGSGGFGKVYRGTFPKDGAVVAVKMLSDASLQSEQQFLAELSVIGRLQHRNLVNLKGWCHDKSKLILVYEFMTNGSLDKHLFSSVDVVLQWQQRFNILKGVAEALAFLHDGWEQRVIHRDVKAANVLLDAKFTARLGDFGLARLMEHSVGPQTMTKAGTTGYIAPELAYTGRATEKSDVYSFGILAMEVVSGRRALDVNFDFDEEGVLLLDWIWQMHERGRLIEVVDAKLKGDFDEEQVIIVLYMALQCCHPGASDRPTMRKCCQMLSGDAAPLTPHASRPLTLYYYPDTPPPLSSGSNSEYPFSSSTPLQTDAFSKVS